MGMDDISRDILDSRIIELMMELATTDTADDEIVVEDPVNNNNTVEEEENELFRIIRENNMAEEEDINEGNDLRVACTFELTSYKLDKSIVPKLDKSNLYPDASLW